MVFLESRYQKGHNSGTKQFSKFKSGVTSTEGDVSLGRTWWAKQVNTWINWRNLSSKTDKSLSMKLLTCWKHHFGKFTAFWKWISSHQIASKFMSCSSATALSLPKLLATYKMTVIPHPPYSWRLVLFDFFVFPNLKKVLNVRIFHVTMNQAKYCDTLADFQTMHFTDYFEQSKGQHFGRRQQWLEVVL